MLGDAMLQTGQGASAASQAQGIAVLASESAEASAQEAADALPGACHGQRVEPGAQNRGRRHNCMLVAD